MKLVGVVVSIGCKGSRNCVQRFHAAQKVVVDQRAMSDLGANVRRGSDLLRPLIGGQEHVDGDVSVRMAVWLNASPLHALYPGIKFCLTYGNVALIGRIGSGVGLA